MQPKEKKNSGKRKKRTDNESEKSEKSSAEASLASQWRRFFDEKHHRRPRCGLYPYWKLESEEAWKQLEREEETKSSRRLMLPSREEIIAKFGLFGTKSRGAKGEDRDGKKIGKRCEMDFTTGACSNGKTCFRCQRWKRFVDGEGDDDESTTKRYYEVFTRELVSGMVKHIEKRCERKKIKKVIVLELGARDGTFARHFVQEWTDEKRTRLEYFACDLTPKHESVTKRDAIEAIREFGKKLEGKRADMLCIAVVSWMPFQIDWTREIRKHSAFDEYILIGEGEGGICGSKRTFGRQMDDDDDDDDDD